MPYLRTKTFDGKRTYYYLVDSHRVNGKVKQTVLKYLGKTRPTDEELKQLIAKIYEA